MNHVYLSPHLDDAVLSCGGAIHRQTEAGEPVLVATTFTGKARHDTALSPFALEQHDMWDNPPRPMALRRAEDRAALTMLGADILHLDYLDAPFRLGSGGQWIYVDLETLMGTVHPADPLARDGIETMAARFAGLIPLHDQQVLYAPLGVGHHVDHQIVHTLAHRLAEQGYRVAFYEDYPYAEKPGAVESALAVSGARDWRVEAIPLSAANLTAKVRALAYYRTQLAGLFGSAEAMPSRVWAFAASGSPGCGLAERIWRLE